MIRFSLDFSVFCGMLFRLKRGGQMAVKKLLNKGTVYKRNDNRWGGAARYCDEQGVTRRKGFCAPTKKALLRKINDYIINFQKEIAEADLTHQPLQKVIHKWLMVFRYSSVERATYDHIEKNINLYIIPKLGKKIIADITAGDLNNLLTDMMYQGYSHATVKHAYTTLNQFFRYLYWIPVNPMARVRMIKKVNFLSAQGKAYLPPSDSITMLTEEEIERIKSKVPFHKQASAYILMLNTGLRTGEVLGLVNSDIDLNNRIMHVNRAVKEVKKRDCNLTVTGSGLVVGKLKSAASKRSVPLNNTAIKMIRKLREEKYFGEGSPLIPDKQGGFLHPSTFRARWYALLDDANVPRKGLHSLRHTFATRLINGVKDENGNLHTLSVKQVAELLGHTTSSVTEKYYVKRELKNLQGITDDFNL